jgi:Icc-related predicted phosphoesterase
MRVHVVSDVHGNAEALARAGDGADVLVVLGDLINFVDYHDHGGGILGSVFGPEKVGEFARLRRERTADLPAFARTLWGSIGDAPQIVEEAVREQYTRLFAAMTAPTYATPGNVDTPDLWPEFAREGLRMIDGEVADIGGLRFGFVGGGLLPPGVAARRPGVFRPYLRTEDDFAAGIARLDDVDVMCTHIPPDVPELTYDVVARRFEYGSQSLLDAIMKQRPRWAVFGHVHQPLAPRMRVGYTECVNVGHFQRTERPYVLRW